VFFNQFLCAQQMARLLHDRRGRRWTLLQDRLHGQSSSGLPVLPEDCGLSAGFAALFNDPGFSFSLQFPVALRAVFARSRITTSPRAWPYCVVTTGSPVSSRASCALAYTAFAPVARPSILGSTNRISTPGS